MKFSLKVQRKNSIVLLTILAIIALALAYFFIYVPANEKHLNQRLFKSIQRIDFNIKAKQDNTFSLMEQLLNKEGQNPNYLNSQFGSSSDLQFRHIAPVQNCSSKVTDEVQRHVNVQKDGSIIFNLIKNCEEIEMSYSSVGYFEKLLGNNVFDEVFVALDSGIVFETFPTGIPSKLFDSLLSKDKANPGATTYPIVLGGSKYQMYLQPFWLGDSRTRGFVAGLVTFQKYEAERDQLPTKETIFIIIAGIFVLILLPWIKLFNLGKKDRLTLADGVMSFVVATLLVSIVFLSFSLLALNYQQFNDKDGMREVANTIDHRTDSFLQAMQTTLKQIDNAMQADSLLENNVVNLLNAERRNFSDARLDKKRLNDAVGNIIHEEIYQIFLINKNTGIETVNWTNDANNSPHPNLASRQYFKSIAIADNNIALESVVSRTTGRFRTILAIKTNNQIDSVPQVLAMSFNMAPLMNVRMVKGYSFALTNQNGEVLYHLDSISNLNQYLPEETDEPEKIINAARVGATTTFQTRYRGVPMQVYSKPIQMAGSRYQLFVFNDQRYAFAKETGAFSFALLMLFLFFLLVFVQLIIIVVFSSRKTLLNKNKLETDWIWPRPSSASVYSFTTTYHIILFAVLAIMYYWFEFIPFLFVLLSASSMVTIFVNYLYYLNAKSLGSKRKSNYKIRNLVPLIALWTIIILIACLQLMHAGTQLLLFISFNLIGIFIGLIIAGIFQVRLYGFAIKKMKLRHTKPQLAGTKADLNFVSKYAAMAISRLLITSGLPVLFFYQYAYNYQHSLLTHERHRDFATKLQESGFVASPGNLPVNFYADSVYVLPTLKMISGHTANTVDSSYLLQQDILRQFRIYHNDQTRELDGVTKHSDYKHGIQFAPPLGKFGRNENFTTEIPVSNQQVLVVSSAPICFHFPFIPDDWRYTGYWLLFLSVIAALYWSIIKVVKRIFALDIPGRPLSIELCNAIIGGKAAPDDKQLLYVVGLPGFGKLDYVLKSVNKSGNLKDANVVVDAYHFDTATKYLQDSSRVLVIDRFEYLLFYKECFDKCLKLIDEAILHPNIQTIILLSSVHASSLLSGTASAMGNSNAESAAISKERLINLLGQFTIFILPLYNHEETTETTQVPSRNFLKKEFLLSRAMQKLQQPIYQESKALQAGMEIKRNADMPQWLAKKLMAPENQNVAANHANKDLKEIVQAWYDNSEANSRDHSIWQLQQMATLFYQQIWYSLSPEERYLVYDLAEEGLVNPTDSYHLSMLIQKGLMVRKEEKGQLQLVNMSFKNFVLTAIDKSQAMQLKASLSSGSSWSDLQTPLMLLVIGILAILMISQHDTFSSIAGYLTAIGALIPTLNAIFGLIKNSASKAIGGA